MPTSPTRHDITDIVDEEIRSMTRGLAIIEQMRERRYLPTEAASERRKRVLAKAREWGIEGLVKLKEIEWTT